MVSCHSQVHASFRPCIDSVFSTCSGSFKCSNLDMPVFAFSLLRGDGWSSDRNGANAKIEQLDHVHAWYTLGTRYVDIERLATPLHQLT